MGLRYDMGNAGDLLKHGVLAEFVRWRREREESFRFIDLFGGEPWEDRPKPEVASRVRAFPEYVALRASQPRIEAAHGRRYYGSGHLVKNIADKTDSGNVRVLVSDSCPARRKRLKDSGLSLLDEKFSFDGYTAFKEIVLGDGDLVLIDPFACFLRKGKYKTVIPQIAEAIEQGAAVILFALNLDPCNSVGRKFEKLLEDYLPRAWRMTMPPLRFPGIRGESKYHAEVVLAASVLKDAEVVLAASVLKDEAGADELKKRLEKLAERLADIPAGLLLKPQTCRP